MSRNKKVSSQMKTRKYKTPLFFRLWEKRMLKIIKKILLDTKDIKIIKK